MSTRNGKTEIEKFAYKRDHSGISADEQLTSSTLVNGLLELEVFDIEHWFSRKKIQWLGLDFYMDL